MTDYSEKPPHMPPGWVAIPKSALKRIGAQAMISSLESTRVTDQEGYRHHVRVRMFLDVANELQRLYEQTIDVRLEQRQPMVEGNVMPMPEERWNLDIWTVDPEYLKAREKARSDSRSTERAQVT